MELARSSRVTAFSRIRTSCAGEITGARNRRINGRREIARITTLNWQPDSSTISKARRRLHPAIVLKADLTQNSSGFTRRVDGACNRASHHDVSRARGNGLGRRHHSSLIIWVSAQRTHAWRDDDEVALQFTAQCGGFPGGSDHALASRGEGERCQSQHLILYPAVYA